MVNQGMFCGMGVAVGVGVLVAVGTVVGVAVTLITSFLTIQIVRGMDPLPAASYARALT